MYNRRKIGTKDIQELNEDLLLDYLEGKMPHARQHQLEEWLEQDPFLRDAVEGLSEVKDKETLRIIAGQINLQLHKQLKQKRKDRRKSKRLKESWNWIFVLLLLLLILVSWLVIKLMIQK